MKIEYIAGFFDAEGYVGVISNKSQGYSLRCTITNTHLGVLQQIQKMVGGKINSKTHLKDNWKNCFFLVLHSSDCVTFLKKIYEHSSVKKEQIRIALTYPINPDRKHLTIEDKRKQREVYYKLKELKSIKYEIPSKYIGIAEKEHEEFLTKQTKALKLHKQGLSLRKIASKIGVSHVMVANYLKG